MTVLEARRTAIPRPRRFRADALTWFAIIVLGALVAIGLLGPILSIGGSSTALIGPRLSPPGPGWPMGTDSLGRSIIPRVVEGLRTTFVLATGAVLVTAVVGTLIGVVAGYVRGAVDEIVVRTADVLFSFPAVLLAILVAAVSGPGAPAAVTSIILVTLPLLTRVVRAAAISVADRDFVVSARVEGASTARIVLVHLLPNVAGPAIVQTTYAVSVGMLVEGGISFLGLGVQPPDASLGSLLREGSIYLTIAPWLALVPGLLLALAILSVNLLGDGLRDALEPREIRTLS
jgi:peptide/nickel transport system permease protein